jgi:hypothetical protein
VIWFLAKENKEPFTIHLPSFNSLLPKGLHMSSGRELAQLFKPAQDDERERERYGAALKAKGPSC